ncbi:MAG: DNA polymerase IV, partial [Anaeroplasmataceae bacterium]|nr:DNA polymerase IV [Anaeroplasmataceae bacterium]
IFFMEKKNNAKIILHVDMNAFFCSVACILNPSLRGQVFAIGRENSYRGVISSASYEARALGIHAAMSQKEAYELVPNLRIVSLDYNYYKMYHEKFVKILRDYSSLVEVASIDEAYVDITEVSSTRHPIVIAKEIQARILIEAGLSCSIGIAPTLFLAKMASDMKKPMGLTILRKRDVVKMLYPLSVADIFGIGKKTYPILIKNDIKTIADFMNPKNQEKIISLIGNNIYQSTVAHIEGHSSNIVDPNRYSEYESISTSRTYERVISSDTEVLYELRKLARSVIMRLNKKDYYTKTITITMRTTNFKTVSRSKSIDEYINDYNSIYDVILELVEEHYKGGLTFNQIADAHHLSVPYLASVFQRYLGGNFQA